MGEGVDFGGSGGDCRSDQVQLCADLRDGGGLLKEGRGWGEGGESGV